MKSVIITSLIFFVVAVVVIATARTSSLTRYSQSHAVQSNADEPPVACVLSASNREDRQGVLDKLGKGIVQRKELDDGFAFAFPAEDEWLRAITEVVALERKCCAFFTFRIVVEPDGPIWLELAGPDGTKDFLRSQLGL